MNGLKHKTLLSKKGTKSSSTTVQIAPFLEASGKKSQFSVDLCHAFVSAGIPLHKLENEKLKCFLQKYSGTSVPASSTLRKGYVKDLYEKTIESMRRFVSSKPIWLSIDETTDSTGRFVAHVVVGVLDGESSRSFLLNAESLEKTNSSTISQAFINALTLLWPNAIQHEKVLLFVTDGAPYMKKAGAALKVIFPKMIHVTCMAHAIHRVAEEIRSLFPDVDKLVSNGKKIFLKATSRVTKFRENAPGLPLPPQPVVTRWGTWLSAAVYYAEHLEAFSRVVEKLDSSDATCIHAAEEILKKPSLKNDLAFIAANFKWVPDKIRELEKKNVLLTDAMDIISDAFAKFQATPGFLGVRIKEKCNFVLDRNVGLSKLKAIADVLRGETPSMGLEEYSPSELACFRFAPITSTEVERTFSILKHTLNDRRQCFSFENLKMILVLSCNEDDE
jgi:hypothetical protein